MNDNLLFFNKEGYPYNFEYYLDAIGDGYYRGNIFFDENSSDTFKTIALYIFEKVDPIKFTSKLSLDEFSIFNYSGISFKGATSKNLTVKSINRVNSSTLFYSKWIFGDRFDELFPKGTVISFSGVTFGGSNTTQNTTLKNDFSKKYYQIIDNKPDAILINTSIKNNFFTGATFLTGCTITSHDCILYNDYTDGIWTQEKLNEFNSYRASKSGVTTLSSTQLSQPYNIKTSIVGSMYNDKITDIVSVATGLTYNQYYIMSGSTGDTIRLDFTLYTERPKIYQGPATFRLTGNTAIITLARQLNSLINIGEGQTIIFEDYNDNPIIADNPIFTINDGINEDDLYQGRIDFFKVENINATKIQNISNKSLSSQNLINNHISAKKLKVYDYYLNFTGDTSELLIDIKPGDNIVVSALTSTPGSTLNEGRQLTVKQIVSFKDFTIQYNIQRIIDDQPWYDFVFKKSQQNHIPIDQQLYLDAVWCYNYDLSRGLISPTTIIQVEEYVIPETSNKYNIKKTFRNHEIRDLECTMTTTVNPLSSFTMNVIGYSTSNVISLSQNIVSTSTGSTGYKHTIDLFNSQYNTYLNNLGIIVYYSSGATEYLNIESKYATFDSNLFSTSAKLLNGTNIIGLLISGNTDSNIPTMFIETSSQLTNEDIYVFETGKTAKNYHGEIVFNLVDNLTTSNGFSIIVNDREFHTLYNGSTIDGINIFISQYKSIMTNIGLTISSGITNSGSTSGDTIIIDGIYPDIKVYNLEVIVNSFSTYEIVNNIYNDFISIDSTSINIPSSIALDYFDLDLATGMIINFSGSNYVFNNGEYNIIGLTNKSMDLSYQGPFFTEHLIDPITGLTYSVHTRTFLRKPRGAYGKDIFYNFKFGTPNSKNIFFYDFTGEHLQPYLNHPDLVYNGPKPLWDTSDVCSTNNENMYLQFEPNTNVEHSSDPTKQQTAWRGMDNTDDCLRFKLERLDSITYYNYVPEPLQVFLGFNSVSEGISEAEVRFNQVEYIIFSGYTAEVVGTNVIYPNFTFSSNGLLTIDTNLYNFDWSNYGFKSQQEIKIDFIDQAKTGHTIFENVDTYRIESVNKKKLQLSGVTDLVTFSTSSSTYQYIIKVVPQRMGRFKLYGKTEIEDDRFRVNLRSLGMESNFDDEAIFKESDINEDGIDYILLNRKRKELLTMYPEFYNYIGSYKALINSINLFGYNDLQLYEYYRNIDPFSPLYQKLHKVLIPDIFDNSVQGFNPQNYIKEKYKKRLSLTQPNSDDLISDVIPQNRVYKKTNLFNLTYQITDNDGNNVLTYSLDDVQYKLMRLKRWLKRNVIPLSANIIDITGVADSTNQMYQNYDVSNQVKKSVIDENTVAINFVYSITQNINTNYFVEVNFYNHSSISVDNGWTCKIQTFSKDENNLLIPQQYFKLLKTDLEDFSFSIDKVIDQFMFIETCYYNDRGFGMVYNKMIDTSTTRAYILINNNFHIPPYNYLNTDQGYYFFNNQGFIYIKD